jgi:hypothetical protein
MGIVREMLAYRAVYAPSHYCSKRHVNFFLQQHKVLAACNITIMSHNSECFIWKATGRYHFDVEVIGI